MKWESSNQGPPHIFQLFCAFLWAVDSYAKYTFFTLATILGFEASTVFQRLKSMQSLRQMGAKEFNVQMRWQITDEVVLSCWIDTDSDAERLNVRLGKPL